MSWEEKHMILFELLLWRYLGREKVTKIPRDTKMNSVYIWVFVVSKVFSTFYAFAMRTEPRMLSYHASSLVKQFVMQCPMHMQLPVQSLMQTTES